MSGLIGRAELLQLLSAGHLFEKDTWSPDQLRGASYDIRAARDALQDPTGKVYPEGEERPEGLLQLDQGAVALLSSVERLCIPWDVAGMLGVKFGLARQGILMLTGVAIDPGYGLQPKGGKWVPKGDARIHFLVTNVGEAPVTIQLGKDPIASIQFAHVPEPTDDEKAELASHLSRPWAENARLAAKGLGFFRVIEGLREEHEALKKSAQAEQRQTAAALHDLRRDLSITRELMNSLVNLGVFVVLATIFLGAAGVLFAFAQSAGLSQAVVAFVAALPDREPAGLIVLAIILLIALVVVELSHILTAWIRRAPRAATDDGAKALSPELPEGGDRVP